MYCMDYWGCLPTNPPYDCPTSPPCECGTCEPCYDCPTSPPCECGTCEPCYGCPTSPPCEWETREPPICPTPEPCPTSPPLTTAGPPECPPATDSPTPGSSPKFSQAMYQSSLPSWPTAGTNVHLGLNASTEDGSPVRYQLMTSFEFVTLSATNDIIFTSNVSDGAYVGPNNVMIIEVVASVIGDESRADSAIIIIVFPRSTANDENNTI